MLSNDVPTRPWEIIASDILEFGGKSFLVIFDYFSKWIEVLTLQSKTAQELIGKFKLTFAYHGIPDVIISDNMPYSSFEFKKFCSENGIRQNTSSPRYPRGNSISERAVGIAKGMLRKNGIENLSSSLFAYRNSPIVGLDFSPSQLLMGRCLKDKLPIVASKLIPCSYDSFVVQEFIKKTQEKNKEYFDRGTVEAKECKPGDNVYFKLDPSESWRKGRVIDQHSARSYLIESESNNVCRRNREHIFIPNHDGLADNNANVTPLNDCSSVNNNVNNTDCTDSDCNGRRKRVVQKPMRYR
uniref:Uncharacterized protein K02A2.6 n=1 Tax=Cacopsylla melanoneura TaxID=428564 RepID=A0A8D9BES0_9HEMI